MIEIVQFTKVDNEFFFFSKDNKKGLSEKDISNLIDKGFVNISRKKFDSILSSI